MFGKNPKRGPVAGDGNNLLVQEIFLTLQGEGPYVGMPAVFIRLGGCNLACNFCDTEFEDFSEQNLTTILQQVVSLAQNHVKLVVITGGEPLRQPIEKLCEELLAASYMVQIETNGTIWRKLPQEVKIICSPKITSRGNYYIEPNLLPKITALKFIISANIEEYKQFPSDLGHDQLIYLQPMDEYDSNLNKRNTDYAMELCLKYGYRLSVQLHKMLNIP